MVYTDVVYGIDADRNFVYSLPVVVPESSGRGGSGWGIAVNENNSSMCLSYAQRRQNMLSAPGHQPGGGVSTLSPAGYGPHGKPARFASEFCLAGTCRPPAIGIDFPVAPAS